MSTLARKYRDFSLSKYSKVHKVELSERLLKTLERNEVERPKVLKQKVHVLNSLADKISKLPEVRDTINSEMQKCKIRAFKMQK